MRNGRRRQLLFAAGAFAAAPLAFARKPARIPTLGVLSFAPPPAADEFAGSPFTAKLKALGWIEGANLRTEAVYASGQLERLPELAMNLVRKGVDAIWAISPPAAVAAARATSTIPIVFARVVWPLELGLADSLARPGRNVTGVASLADPMVIAKPLEYLREILPGAKRLGALAPGAVLYKTVSGGEFSPKPAISAVDSMGFHVERRFVDTIADLDAAFADLAAFRADALFVTSSPLIVAQARRIVNFALQQKLPCACIESTFVEAGALLSYGSDVWDTIFQSLECVDKILRGAKPADLPIEQPRRFDLVINLRTAKALGLPVPPSVLLRADRVIE